MKTKEENYLQRRSDTISYLAELYTNIRYFKEIRASVFGLSIRSSYFLIATLNVSLDLTTESKQYFFKGAKITYYTFLIFKENFYPNLSKTGSLPFTALFSTSFLDAILCDSEDLLFDYARTIEDMGVTNPPFNYEITYALKYLILEDFERAKEHALKAHQSTYFKLPYKGFSHVVMGILEKNVDLINEGIALRLKHHERENKTSIFYSTSIEATALIKLANRFDLTPDVNSPFINKALLQKDLDIQYEGIDEILNALQEADQKNGSLLNRISGWLKKK